MSAIEVKPVAGDDAWGDFNGLWTLFELEAGNDTQRQHFRFVPSTSSYTTWLPENGSCQDVASLITLTIDECAVSRGVGLYEGSQSTGWTADSSTSYRLLGISYPDLGKLPSPQDLFGAEFNQSNNVGLDFVSVQDANNTWVNGPRNTTVFGERQLNYVLPTLGLGIGEWLSPTGIQYNSWLKSLADRAMIPSRSWGYTAGAAYHNSGSGARGSLVLGGYDAGRVDGNTTATLQIQRDTGNLLVDVAGITVEYTSQGAGSYTETFKAVIDSSLPYLYLPDTAIDFFVQRFNLTETTDGYFFIDTTSADTNQNVTTGLSFVIQDGIGGDNTNSTTITLPYNAFDVAPHWSFGEMTGQRMFPIRRQVDPDLAVLGRAFLAEAYIHANHEPDVLQFNLSQRAYPDNNAPADIVAVLATPDRIIDDDSGISRGAVAGAVIGAVAGVAIIVFGIFWFFRRKRKARDAAAAAALHEKDEAEKRDMYGMAAGDKDDDYSRRGTVSSAWLSEVDGTSSPRPGHKRHESYMSELSSDSDHERAQSTMVGMATLHERHELEDRGQSATIENGDDQRAKVAGGSGQPSPMAGPQLRSEINELPGDEDWTIAERRPDQVERRVSALSSQVDASSALQDVTASADTGNGSTAVDEEQDEGDSVATGATRIVPEQDNVSPVAQKTTAEGPAKSTNTSTGEEKKTSAPSS